MHDTLQVSIGQYSAAGDKPANQDFHGAWVPEPPLRATKGVALALADGISSSEVSHIASELAVSGFLQDYYCTSEAWSVQRSVQRVLSATNSWLHSHTRRGHHDENRGYVCTFSAMVVKGATAHLFHVGDARIYRVRGATLEQLTEDHRLWVSARESYLARALGVQQHVEIDYVAVQVQPGDVFLLATDGVYEHIDGAAVAQALRAHSDTLDAAAQALVAAAYANGSDDNLTAQLLRIDAVAAAEAGELQRQLAELPAPPLPEAGATLDGYRIVRELHASSRSHVYLALEEGTGTAVALKIPSLDLRHDPAYLERFLTEEWIGRRIHSPHVVAVRAPVGSRNYLYTVSEYLEGRTLAQWLRDQPRPELETVRAVVEQIAKGLQAFHRLEMLHQDLRPENVMIDATGTVKIIDFGATRVAGLAELAPPGTDILGTAQYAAPEYFLGEGGSERSDLYSLAAITYRMLSGQLPYGADVARTRTRAAQAKLRYRSVLDPEREVPAWIDDTLRKALHPDPYKRHAVLSEFVHELRHPNPVYLAKARPPLIERNPVLVWQTIAALLALTLILAL